MKIAALGEIMLRLKSPGEERLFQSPVLEATFGGAEANSVISLANYGMQTKMITALPDNDITLNILRTLRAFSVDTSDIILSDGRVGIYFVEKGAGQRPQKIVYDRAYSSFSTVSPDLFDFSSMLSDCTWLHLSGVTPALSETTAALTLNAAKAAKKLGITVSCDLNYRENLWNYGKSAKDVMGELMQYTDVVIANEEECQKVLGIDAAGGSDDAISAKKFESISREILKRYPSVSTVSIILRQNKAANLYDLLACICNKDEFYFSEKYEIDAITDRIGAGDSFGGGLIYGLLNYENAGDAVEFALAASCLKHSVMGDFNRVSKEEVEALMRKKRA